MASEADSRGKLYLIPTTLGENAPLEVLPISIQRIIEQTDHYIAENEKSARRFIKRISPRKPQTALQILQLNKYTEAAAVSTYLDPCLTGHHVGLVSEAGCPAVADPGAELVRLAHEKQLEVIPLVGPSSLILALMASGLNGQNFAFNGYLPIESAARKAAIRNFEKRSREASQTQLFIETPYRNNSLLADLLRALSRNTLLCIASDLTLPTQFIATKPVHSWKDFPLDLHKRPTVFLIQAGEAGRPG